MTRAVDCLHELFAMWSATLGDMFWVPNTQCTNELKLVSGLELGTDFSGPKVVTLALRSLGAELLGGLLNVLAGFQRMGLWVKGALLLQCLLLHRHPILRTIYLKEKKVGKRTVTSHANSE